MCSLGESSGGIIAFGWVKKMSIVDYLIKAESMLKVKEVPEMMLENAVSFGAQVGPNNN